MSAAPGSSRRPGFRLRRAAAGLARFAVLQGAWFAAVLGAGEGIFWLGPVAVAVLVAAHLSVAGGGLRELGLLVAVGVAGTAADSLQACLGLLEIAGAPARCLAPPWITALWVHLVLLLRYPLSWLVGRPLVAAVFGAVGGPLAYAAGVGFGAASFHPRPLYSVVALAVVWGLALPAAGWVVERGEG